MAAKAEKSAVSQSPSPKKADLPEVMAYGPFGALQREMDDLFRDFSSRFSMFPPRRRADGLVPNWRWPARVETAFPSIDVKENKNHFTITAELPGLKRDDIDVSVDDGMLTISGETKSETKDEDDEHVLTERYEGRFKRSLCLPETVDAAKTSAKMDDGVLTVTLPKTKKAHAKARKIAIS